MLSPGYIDFYISSNSSTAVSARAHESLIQSIAMDKDSIRGTLVGGSVYQVHIDFSDDRILNTKCSCPYDYAGLCKHEVRLLSELKDIIVTQSKDEKEDDVKLTAEQEAFAKQITYLDGRNAVISDFDYNQLTERFIKACFPQWRMNSLHSTNFEDLEVNKVKFFNTTSPYDYNRVDVRLNPRLKDLSISCTCNSGINKLCTHRLHALVELTHASRYQLFFDEEKRSEQYQLFAKNYQLTEKTNLEDYFELVFDGVKSVVRPRPGGLLILNTRTISNLQQVFIPNTKVFSEAKLAPVVKEEARGIVFTAHRYYNNLHCYFFKTALTKAGLPKNPLLKVDLFEESKKYESADEVRFVNAVQLFSTGQDEMSLSNAIDALKMILKNPLKLPFYKHNTRISDNLTVQSIEPIETKVPIRTHLALDISEKDELLEIIGYLVFDDRKINLSRLKLRHKYLFECDKVFYPAMDELYLTIHELFKKHQFKLVLPKVQFEEFKQLFLDPMSEQVAINYGFFKTATKQQVKQLGFLEKENVTQKIYLTESDNYILITPIIQYGSHEISVLSQQQITEKDEEDNWFYIKRDHLLESRFMEELYGLNEHFKEQVNEFDHLYIHKRAFYDSGWFADAFEVWKASETQVFGFKELSHPRLTTGKLTVGLVVSSNTDWFDTKMKIQFGDKPVALKQVVKALKNNSRYVALDDGTNGLLPEAWIQKFEKYFRSGTLTDEGIRTSKINYGIIDELYEAAELDVEVIAEIEKYKRKLADFQSIQAVVPPKNLKATLRDYQKQGLNWLNFLDEFNFGGCLADDMGLGKTIQVIAFLLQQKAKNKGTTNLVVLPTSLIFNWEEELEKFAPSLKVLTHRGVLRGNKSTQFQNYDIVLTTYGTMLSDITFLKEFYFNYIVLDESQAIKNPLSKRYKATRLLQSRNKLVLTGTPIENNTFDLYAQFSFLNPLIFGSQQQFKDVYSTPIDKFKDIERANELQSRINPFLLRRTKKQVASELPDKTEKVVYCEMGEEQRRVYDAYKNKIRESLLGNDDDFSGKKSMLVLTGLTKLRQICNSPLLLNDEEDFGNSSAKMDFLIEEILERSTRHKILVFSQFVSMLDLIREKLDEHSVSHEYLTGQSTNRSELVHRFQNDAETRVFLISLKAGGTGLNLTEADYVYLVDPWWNPAVENQAIDRCYRIGQKKNVVAVRLITPNTIEEKILQLQASKKELADDLIKTDANILKSLSKESILDLFL